MYFIPEKGRFYRWAVHTKPVFRYGITGLALGVIASLWFFVLDPWLSGLVQFEQAAVIRATQQATEVLAAKQAIAHKEGNMKKTNETMKELACKACETDAISFIFDAAQKSKISLASFMQEKETSKEWRIKKYAALSGSGTLDHIFDFFTKLSQSPHMIQCKNCSLQRTEDGIFSMRCTLETITLMA